MTTVTATISTLAEIKPSETVVQLCKRSSLIPFATNNRVEDGVAGPSVVRNGAAGIDDGR